MGLLDRIKEVFLGKKALPMGEKDKIELLNKLWNDNEAYNQYNAYVNAMENNGNKKEYKQGPYTKAQLKLIYDDLGLKDIATSMIQIKRGRDDLMLAAKCPEDIASKIQESEINQMESQRLGDLRNEYAKNDETLYQDSCQNLDEYKVMIEGLKGTEEIFNDEQRQGIDKGNLLKRIQHDIQKDDVGRNYEDKDAIQLVEQMCRNPKYLRQYEALDRKMSGMEYEEKDIEIEGAYSQDELIEILGNKEIKQMADTMLKVIRGYGEIKDSKANCANESTSRIYWMIKSQREDSKKWISLIEYKEEMRIIGETIDTAKMRISQEELEKSQEDIRRRLGEKFKRDVITANKILEEEYDDDEIK